MANSCSEGEKEKMKQKKHIKLKLTPEEAEILSKFLIYVMKDMMSLNTQNHFSKTPILTEEESQQLNSDMDFCTCLLRKIQHSK